MKTCSDVKAKIKILNKTVYRENSTITSRGLNPKNNKICIIVCN